MKQILTFIAGILMIAGLHAQEVSKAETLKGLLNGVITFKADEINQNEPLTSIRELAASNAAKTILLSKENIVSVLDELGNYNGAVIIVGGHTIAMITDAGDCQQSGAWGACMPKAKGFVQKQGKLIAHENYINFIIGVPDSQERTMFLFE